MRSSHANETGKMKAACSKQAGRVHSSIRARTGCINTGRPTRNIPQGLKPRILCACYGTTKVLPFQNPEPQFLCVCYGTTKVVPFQNPEPQILCACYGTTKVVPFQNPEPQIL